jgi:carboxymethylenebutenolidase
MRFAPFFTLAVVFAVAAPAFSQDWAKARVDKSPRHLEYVKVKSGEKDLKCFIAFPEVKEKATAVVVIHEIFGLADWIRSVTDQLAEAGYIAIAPDLLTGNGPKGGGTEEFTDGSAIRQAVFGLNAEQVTADLNATVDYVAKLPACNGKVVVAGFCWGGMQSFRFATNNKAIKAAYVFYGNGPDNLKDIERIAVPVYGFYGGNDARVNMTIPRSKELMEQAGRKYDPVTYEGAGHGFLRAGEDPEGSAENKKAREEAWKRWKELLAKV